MPIRPLRHIRGPSRHPRCSRARGTYRYRVRPEASTAAPHQAHRPFFNEPLGAARKLRAVVTELYFRRHLTVYEWIADRAHGRRVVDLACGEGYGSAVLARTAASVVGVDANPEAFEHARLKYTGERVRFERSMLELWRGDVDCVVFLQTIEHVHDPDAGLDHIRDLIGPAGGG